MCSTRSTGAEGWCRRQRALCSSFAFRTTKVERIYAPIFAENAKSRRAAEKMGLRFEGVLRSCVEFRGERRDEAIYAIVRGDLGPTPTS